MRSGTGRRWLRTNRRSFGEVVLVGRLREALLQLSL